jgi:hypothetical protein
MCKGDYMLKPELVQTFVYGSPIYDRVFPQVHLLKLPDKAGDFSFVNEFCRDAYSPEAAFDPTK